MAIVSIKAPFHGLGLDFRSVRLNVRSQASMAKSHTIRGCSFSLVLAFGSLLIMFPL